MTASPSTAEAADATVLNAEASLPGARPVSLKANFAFTLAGNLTYAASQWGIVVLLAQLTSPSVVGEFALAFAITAPVFVLAQLKLRGVLATDHVASARFGVYLGLRCLTTAVAAILVALLCVLLDLQWSITVLTLLAAAMRSIDSIADIYHGFLQRAEDMGGIATAFIINGVVSLTAFGGTLLMTKNVPLAMFGCLIGSLSSAAYSVRRVRSSTINRDARIQCVSTTSDLHLSFAGGELQTLVRVAFPAGLATGFATLIANAPRYAISDILDEAALGVFASLSYVMVAATLVVPALGQVAVPRLARYYAEGDLTAFRYLLTRLLCVGAVIGGGAVAVAVVAAKPLLRAVYGEVYAAESTLFLLLSITTALSAAFIFLGTAVAATRHFRQQVPVMAGSFVVLAIALWLTLPRIGLHGAAYSLMAAAVVEAAGNALYLQRILAKRSRGLRT